MTKITRRNFAKRTGATLGGALALGMLPSLTRKLHAEDTSSSPTQGVRALWSTGQIAANYKVDGGILNMSIVLTASAPADTCVASVGITTVRKAKYTKIKNGKTYSGTTTRTDNFYWRCENGVPTMVYAYHTGNSTAPIANLLDPNETIGNLTSVSWTSDDHKTVSYDSKIWNDETGQWTPLYPVGSLGYEIICCWL